MALLAWTPNRSHPSAAPLGLSDYKDARSFPQLLTSIHQFSAPENGEQHNLFSNSVLLPATLGAISVKMCAKDLQQCHFVHPPQTADFPRALDAILEASTFSSIASYRLTTRPEQHDRGRQRKLAAPVPIRSDGARGGG